MYYDRPQKKKRRPPTEPETRTRPRRRASLFRILFTTPNRDEREDDAPEVVNTSHDSCCFHRFLLFHSDVLVLFALAGRLCARFAIHFDFAENFLLLLSFLRKVLILSCSVLYMIDVHTTM